MSGTIALESGELSVGERDGATSVTIVRQGDRSSAVRIDYQITPSSTNAATAGVDYDATLSGSVALAAGADRVSIPVTIRDDLLAEGTETFVVSLVNVGSGALLAPRTARVDILDNESPEPLPAEPSLSSTYDVAQDVVIGGLNQPIKFEFSPVDPNIVHVAEKGGLIKVHDLATGVLLNTLVDLRVRSTTSRIGAFSTSRSTPTFRPNPISMPPMSSTRRRPPGEAAMPGRTVAATATPVSSASRPIRRPATVPSSRAPRSCSWAVPGDR